MILQFLEWIQNQDNLFENEVANYLSRAADAIAKIVGGKVVVILGRDAWPLVPLLRHRGVRTQYFLYSRLQIGDKSTREMWLKEVPRRSYVIDTGYAGSIIDDIKKFDPSIKGILMSSTGKYPELEVDGQKISRKTIVGNLEHEPKLIRRSIGYVGPYALTSPNKKDLDTGAQDKPLTVIPKNYDLLRDAGLPDDVAKQYSKFSGISPKDRLGREDYLSHWRRVQNARQKKEKLRLNYEEQWKKIVDLAKNGLPYKWDWRKLPEEIRNYYAKRASTVYDKATKDYNSAIKELKTAKPWDEDHVREIHEKIKRLDIVRNNLRRLVGNEYSFGFKKLDDYDDYGDLKNKWWLEPDNSNAKGWNSVGGDSEVDA